MLIQTNYQQKPKRKFKPRKNLLENDLKPIPINYSIVHQDNLGV